MFDRSYFLFFSLVLLLLSVIAGLSIGTSQLPASELLPCLLGNCPSTLSETILWEIRIPRVLLAFLVGAGLAWSGAILQSCTNNPLADPYLFGIVSGAGFGATVATFFVPEQQYIYFPMFAFVGALLATAAVVVFARKLQNMEQMILLGVAVAFLLGALTQGILYLQSPFASNRILFWLLGSLSNAEMWQVYIVLVILVLVSVLGSAFHRQLDAMLLDEESARALGVNTDNIRRVFLALAALLTATIVSFCGGIGFIGLMIPHIVRYVVGSSMRKLLYCSVLFGGIFLLWVDIIARQLLQNQELPIGIVTSLIGGLFFIVVLCRTRAP